MEENDIFKYFPDFLYRVRKNKRKNKKLGNSEFENIYNALSKGILSVDKIALMTKLSTKEVMQKLTLMELEDLIIYEIGKGFRLKGV